MGQGPASPAQSPERRKTGIKKQAEAENLASALVMISNSATDLAASKAPLTD